MSAPQTQQQSKQLDPQVQQDANAKLQADLDRVQEFVPFMAKDPIQLSARMVIRFLAKPTKSGKNCSLDMAIRFVMLCKSRGLNPWEGDAYLVGYDTKDGPEFNLITAHQALLKRAEVHPEHDGMESGVIIRRGDQIIESPGSFLLADDVLLGGWAKIFSKNRTRPMYSRVNLAAYNKGYSRWQVDPAGMIQKVAEANALRHSYPNSLGGMYLNEEFEPIDQEQPVRMIEPQPLPAGRMDLRTPKAPAASNGHQQTEQPAPIQSNTEAEPQSDEQPQEPETKSEPQAAQSETKTAKTETPAQAKSARGRRDDRQALDAVRQYIVDNKIPDKLVEETLRQMGRMGEDEQGPIDLKRLSEPDCKTLQDELAEEIKTNPKTWR